MDLDLAVNGGTIVASAGRAAASIGVARGRIVTVSSVPLAASTTIDATGLHVIPGVIDAHTHFRDPAYPEKEDFESGTAAAAAGGVTTVLEMPVSDVGVCTAERLDRRKGLLKPKAHVDFGLYGAAGQQSVAKISEMAAHGAIAFKSFLREPYAARALNFEGMWVTDDGALYEIAHAVAATGLLWTVHAENHAIVAALKTQRGAGAIEDPETFVAVRPDFIEEMEVRKILEFARDAGARVQITHITTARALEAVIEARRRGVRATAEACIPHLALDEDSIRTAGGLGRTTPRLRPRSDVEALWAGLRSGEVDIIASDHASYTQHDVEVGWDGKGSATSGYASIEHMLPLLLTRSNEGHLPLEGLVRAMCERPAQLFGLWPRKGSLLPGADADLTCIDLRREQRIDQAAMRSKAKYSIFHGWSVRGMPVCTIVRGLVVMREGEIVGPPGHGELVRAMG